MIALLAGLALADPCAREVVLSRGLTADPVDGAAALAELHVELVLRRRRVDGIPSTFVRHARAFWTWTVTVPGDAVVVSSVGDGNALCEGEVTHQSRYELGAGTHQLEGAVTGRKLDACRVRVVLKQTLPAAPAVTLDVSGATPPGPDAPVDGPLELTPGSDLVIDIPGCF